MKAIIDGKRFDTEKAIEIGGAESHHDRNNFSWWRATLYVTPKSRNYFLAGRGGPMSPWSRATGMNSYTGGAGIWTLSKSEALAWAQEHLKPEVIEAHFADVIEDA